MKIKCIAILGQDDSPLFLKAYGDDADDEMKFQCLAFTCIDLIEEKLAKQTERDMFLGLLQNVGALLIYGYITNTRIKILLFIVNSTIHVSNRDVIEVFKKIHLEYVKTVSNPFYEFIREDCSDLALPQHFADLFNTEE